MTNFSWTRQWYPITPVSYLDTSEPTAITLLGKRLVVWQNQKRQWIAMDDRCPHKLAQLSLGSINQEGNLVCRHHGWCFDQQGKCINIPMLKEQKALKTAINSDRSQVTTYPTQVLQGLLWIWADNSDTHDLAKKQSNSGYSDRLKIFKQNYFVNYFLKIIENCQVV
jgi:phenylpropionate dioxygenase-like ring-hydroxylating dioxygenase large terminal subunit